MQTLLIIVHVLICVFMVVIVLLQHGKGASMGAAFGGSSQTVFGTEGPLPLLNKITTAGAILFMITSLALAVISSRTGDGSVVREMKAAPAAQQEKAPELPTAIPLPPAASEGGQTFPGPETGNKTE